MNPEAIKGLRVLVVEDEVIIAEELKARLPRLGATVVAIADTGVRAIEAAAEHGPDLVLMDINLKGPMDGIEAAGIIRERRQIPVLFLTAHSDPQTLGRAKGADPFGYLLKPFDERNLVVGIEMAMHRHRMDGGLRETGRRQEATLGSIGDGVIATDAEGLVTFMNPMAEELTGWPLAEARGRPVTEVFSILAESTRTLVENPVMQALELNRVVDAEEPVLLVPHGGAPIAIEETSAPIAGNNGTPRGAVVVFRDIRRRRLAEAAEKRALEQTHQTQKMEAVGLLSGGVAHNFNNLLTVISGFSELLLETGGLDKAARGSLTEIKEAGQRGTRLTRRLAAFARKQILQPVTLDLGLLVPEVARTLGRLFGGDLSLNIACMPDLWSIHADPAQIEQVIMNLASNSHAAMPRGGMLKIGVQNVELAAEVLQPWPDVHPGHYVQLEISDTGTGMDQATLSRGV